MITFMPIIATDHIDEVRAYYTEKLGFREDLVMRGPDGKINTLMVTSPAGATLMFGPPEGTSALNPDGLMLFITSEGVDAYHAQVTARGVDIAEGLTDQFWGDRTFIVRDPWGLHLMFGQTVKEMDELPEGYQIETAQPVG